MIKKEIRVLGVAWTSRSPESSTPTQIVGVVFRGNRWLEGVMRTTVPPDTSDLTLKTANMVTSSPHFPQLRIILTDELFTGSGTYLDMERLSRKTRIPVVAVLRGPIPRRWLSIPRSRIPPVRAAFAKLTCTEWEAGTNRFSVCHVGLGKTDLGELLGICASLEGMPEAVRVARMIATSLERFLARRHA